MGEYYNVYKTIVVDLLSGRILHVGDGKGAEALDGFWKRLGDSKAKIKGHVGGVHLRSEG